MNRKTRAVLEYLYIRSTWKELLWASKAMGFRTVEERRGYERAMGGVEGRCWACLYLARLFGASMNEIPRYKKNLIY